MFVLPAIHSNFNFQLQKKNSSKINAFKFFFKEKDQNTHGNKFKKE